MEEVCRKTGSSIQTYDRWHQKYGGLLPFEMWRLKQFEEENTRVRRLVADRSLEPEMPQDAVRRKR